MSAVEELKEPIMILKEESGDMQEILFGNCSKVKLLLLELVLMVREDVVIKVASSWDRART